MALSTLVIGLGGTGVLTTRALKKLYSELPEQDRVPASFLAIDFDRANKDLNESDSLAELDDDEFLYLSPEGIQIPIRNIDRTHDRQPAWEKVRDWFPDPNELKIPTSDVEANGAGQFRMLGRLGFFVYGNLIEKTIMRAYERLEIEIDSGTASRERRIILAASIAGGTGSGLMIDLAYIARRHLQNRPHVFAYLLLPDVFAEVDQGGRIYQNGYAALRELAHLKDQQIPFEADYYEIAPIDIPAGGEQPFSRLFLFGRAFSRNGNQVVAANLQMARTILAQLHRTIQERSLSVAANTTSSDIATERQRLRTHCFSTAGSQYVEFGQQQKIDSDILFRSMLQLLNDREELTALMEGQGRRLAENAGERLELEVSGRRRVRSDSDENLASDEASNIAAALGNEWKAASRVAATTAVTKILSDLEALSKDLRERTRWHRDEATISEAIAQIDRLKRLAFADLEQGKVEARLRELDELKLEAVGEASEAMEGRIRRFLDAGGDRNDRRFLLARKSLVDQLARLKPELVVELPSLSTEMAKLKEQADKVQAIERETTAADRPRKLVSDLTIRRQQAVALLCILEDAMSRDGFRERLEALIRKSSFEAINRRIDAERESIEGDLRPAQAKLQRVLHHEEILESDAKDKLPERIEVKLRGLLEQRLPAYLRVVGDTDLSDDETPEARRGVLLQLFRQHVLADSELEKARFTEDRKTLENQILEALVNIKQDIFVRRTPNPQRKGFAIVLCPRGIEWERGSIETFLEVNTEQLLLCRCTVQRYGGSRIWIYYEDLFNPPEHIRNLDDYYTTYRSQAHPELFHIDRRFLTQRDFRQIVTGTSTFVVHCGNDGCEHNIARVPRTQVVCPGCGRWIRSRCGNPECPEDSLHRVKGGIDPVCPGCGCLNQAAWWRCSRHGKDEVLVPVDKAHCPRCIERHHDDPLGFPKSCISQRPDLDQAIDCFSCVARHAIDPSHEIYQIKGDLLRFYRDGVNGHDLETFRRDARRRYGLPDGFRCPSCRSHLIPVHHRSRVDRHEVCR